MGALEWAQAPSRNVVAVHIGADPGKADDLEAAWETWGRDIRLVVVDSPYRALTRPLLHFLAEHKRVEDADIATVVVPEYVPESWWEHLLHNQSALRLKAALVFAPGFFVVSIPFQERRVAT